MSEYAINVDWQADYDKWENLGRAALEEHCTHKTRDKDSNEANRETNVRYGGYCEECDVSEDSAIPMMNYYYPLTIKPDEDKILKIVNETNLTVMYNDDQDMYVLALTGGGMNLSQDVGLAYLYAQHWIPYALLIEISTQPELSVSGSKWLFLAREVKSQLRHYELQIKEQRKVWTNSIKEYKGIHAKRKVEAKEVKKVD